MRTKPLALLGLLVLSLLSGATASARVAIVATLPDLGAVARAVGGAEVDVTVLATPTEDPHYVDPRPSYLVQLSKCDLVLANGLELEVGWLPPLLVNARNPRIATGAIGNVEAAAFVRNKLQVPGGKIDRAMGDIHPGGNPHFTFGPDALVDIARGLAGRLALIDPTHAADYARRAEAFAHELGAVASAARARLATLPADKRLIVVYHDSLPYLSSWLGLEQVATIEDKPGIKPSPSHVASVLGEMKRRSVKVILQEVWHPESASRTLANLAGAQVIQLAGGPSGDESLVVRLRALADRIYDALAK